MAIFQKKPQTSSSAPLYTLGLNRTVLLVGLGNVGKTYDGTRHNLGFFVLDNFVARQSDFSTWTDKKDLKCHIASGNLNSTRVIAIKPTTLMNNSGEAVKAVSHFYKVPPQQVLVIHDELDLPFGTVRTSFGGSSAGHNGVMSVIGHLTPDFNRIRIGINNDRANKMDSADFVLKRFDKNEEKHIDTLAQETVSLITEFIYGNGKMPTQTRSFIA